MSDIQHLYIISEQYQDKDRFARGTPGANGDDWYNSAFFRVRKMTESQMSQYIETQQDKMLKTDFSLGGLIGGVRANRRLWVRKVEVTGESFFAMGEQ